MPNILTMLINYFVLTKKLNCRPLELLRDEKVEGNFSSFVR